MLQGYGERDRAFITDRHGAVRIALNEPSSASVAIGVTAAGYADRSLVLQGADPVVRAECLPMKPWE